MTFTLQFLIAHASTVEELGRKRLKETSVWPKAEKSKKISVLMWACFLRLNKRWSISTLVWLNSKFLSLLQSLFYASLLCVPEAKTCQPSANLLPSVFSLLGQRVVAGKDSGVMTLLVQRLSRRPHADQEEWGFWVGAGERTRQKPLIPRTELMESQSTLTLNLKPTKVLAWENSRRFARSPLEPSQNDVWVTSTEIPYWWRATNQI